jgi:hypothetical protein
MVNKFMCTIRTLKLSASKPNGNSQKKQKKKTTTIIITNIYRRIAIFS